MGGLFKKIFDQDFDTEDNFDRESRTICLGDPFGFKQKTSHRFVRFSGFITNTV